MLHLSRTERAALCNSALEAGEDAPTLCEGWTVKDLVIHLLLRERDPLAAPGILVPQLHGLTQRSARRMESHDFSSLVERVRSGPPKWSPMAIPQVDQLLNSLEYFVHHEDIRRAAPGWEPRELTDRERRILFKGAATAGKGVGQPGGGTRPNPWAHRGRGGGAGLPPGGDPRGVPGGAARA